jgi:hypothetical protein
MKGNSMPNETEPLGLRIMRALKMLNTIKRSGFQRPSFTFAYDAVKGYVVEVNGVDTPPTFETAAEALEWVEAKMESIIAWQELQTAELRKAMEPVSAEVAKELQNPP